LHPDRLAEHLVVRELLESSEFADSCLGTIEVQQAVRPFSLLARARADNPQAGPLFDKLLIGLLYYFSHHDASIKMMTRVADLIPYPALRLIIADQAFDKFYETAPPLSADPDRRRRFLHELTDRLHQLAVLVQEFPTAEPRDLGVRKCPGTGLSPSGVGADGHDPREGDRDISQPGTRLYHEGKIRAPSGTTALEEAAAIFRGLVGVYPDQYVPMLAGALKDLRDLLAKAGRDAESEEVRLEAARLQQEYVSKEH
jgi:hypothetical protein